MNSKSHPLSRHYKRKARQGALLQHAETQKIRIKLTSWNVATFIWMAQSHFTFVCERLDRKCLPYFSTPTHTHTYNTQKQTQNCHLDNRRRLIWMQNGTITTRTTDFMPCSCISQTFFRGETHKITFHIPSAPAYKNERNKYKGTVVSAGRLFQDFQLSDKNSSNVSRHI